MSSFCNTGRELLAKCKFPVKAGKKLFACWFGTTLYKNTRVIAKFFSFHCNRICRITWEWQAS
jgi:hypothetical protein